MTVQCRDVGALTVTVSADPGAQRLREWDDLVRDYPSSDVAQLSGWARTRAVVGIEAVYVLALRDGELVGGAQVLVRRLPGLGRAGYVPYGPLVRPSAEEPVAVHEALADGLARLARGRLRMIFVQPPLGNEAGSEVMLRKGFRLSDAGIAPACSSRVDLTVDEARLKKNLSRRLRTWTNRWESAGITVRMGNEHDLPVLARLLQATGEHQGFEAFSVQYFESMHRELGPAGNLAVFVGEAAGEPVAMVVATVCGGMATARLVGFDRASPAASMQVPAAVNWTAMRWAKDNGCRWYDFGGLHESTMQRFESGEPVDIQSLHGPDQYKLRFGGRHYRYPPAVELIGSPVIRAAYDLARRSQAGRSLVTRAKRMARTGALPRPAGPSAPSDG